MSAIQGKYHISIGDFGFLLAKQPRIERHIYSREESPHFVNKFSSGDPNYRDSTFFPHWVQLNWLNGFNQEFFDDGGKFFRSSAVDPTDQTKLTIQKAFNSAGQVVAGVDIRCAVALIQTGATQSWANSNYLFRKQITITAPASQTMPVGYPVKITEDTAALETAAKLRADRKDWRVFYFNGSTWNDLFRDYIGTTETWVATQVQIAGGASDTSHYIYYNYATESTTKQPSANADWNSVYSPPNDTNTKGLWHVKEVSGTTIADTSGNAHDGTLTGGTFVAGKFGKGISFNGTSDKITITNHADFRPTGAFTMKAWIKTSSTARMAIFSSWYQAGSTYQGIRFFMQNGNIQVNIGTGVSGEIISLVTTGTYNDNVLHQIAYSWDGSTMYIYVDNVQVATKANTSIPSYNASNRVGIGVDTETNGVDAYFWSGVIDGVAFLNGTAQTSFPEGVVTGNPTVTQGSEVAKANASSSAYIVLAGASNGKIYKWDGITTWTQVYDTTTPAVNCAVIHTISGVQYAYFGTGDLDGLTDGLGKIYRTSDASTFTLAATITGDGTAGVSALGVYNSNLYAGVFPKAKVYKSTDGTTFTLSKDIDEPNNPGWIWDFAVYAGKLYAGGGHPQQFRTSNSAGFLFSWDDFEWKFVGNFDFTVVKDLKVYDNLLFIGTISKRLYVFNTSSIDKLLEFPWDVAIEDMETWQDKLAIALGPTDRNNPTGEEAVYLFDRNGFHKAFTAGANATRYTTLLSINNILLAGTGASGYVYRTVDGQYQLTGNVQSSYFEAQLPNIHKIWRDVTIIFDSLPAGCSLIVDYKTDEADAAWTNLGTANTPLGTTATFNFAAAIYSYKLSIRVTLTTTNVAKTPVLRKVIAKYVLSPDFKYLWKMKLLCIDKIIWIDGTEPQALLNANVSAGATSITLKSTDVAIPTSGFPNPNGSAMYASIINPSTGVADRFTYTGKTNTTLTGIPATGANAIGAHNAGDVVRITGGDIHQKILDLKQTRTLYTFTDIDGLTYTVLFHAYQADNWVVNQDDYYGGLENEVPITLLEA